MKQIFYALSRIFFKRRNVMRSEWARVPPPEWAAKRGGVEIW